jgi:hypothetical protein
MLTGLVTAPSAQRGTGRNGPGQAHDKAPAQRHQRHLQLNRKKALERLRASAYRLDAGKAIPGQSSSRTHDSDTSSRNSGFR